MNAAWFKAATVRAAKTAAQSALGVIGATTLFSSIQWDIVGGTVLVAAITSYLTSIKGLPEVKEV